MNLETFLLMRNELMLLVVILMLVVGEIFISNKKALIPWAIVLFAIHTIISFFHWIRDPFLAECLTAVN